MPETQYYPKVCRLVLWTKEAEASSRGEMLKRLYLAVDMTRTQCVRNISKSTTAEGPSVPGEFPHADSSRLRNSIFGDVDEAKLTGIVGTNLNYGCVFGYCVVPTDKGMRQIFQIRRGDRVLTQAGDWRTVLAINKRPALEKPNLVELTFPWRRGKDHVLTVTADHRILVLRDARNKWLAAGDLLDTDKIYMRRKLVHNRGCLTRPQRPCRNCGRVSFNRLYCSVDCRAAYWARTGTNPHLGRKRSALTRQRQSVVVRRRLAERPETHPNRLLACRGIQPCTERRLERWLQHRGMAYRKQAVFGPFLVDFYLPDSQTIMEADGAYWHRNQQRDIDRDRLLLQMAPRNARIVHVHFYDPRFSPAPFDSNPLANVYYVACNPGPESYVDPERFQAVPLKRIRKWTYRKPTTRPGGLSACVYDITVEGVH